jgi:heavy-metal-associated domain-containing protein
VCWASGAPWGVAGRSMLEGRRQVSSAAVTGAASSAPRAVDLSVQGMTCAACAARVEKKLNSIDDVCVTVNLATERATVTAPATAARRRGWRLRRAGPGQDTVLVLGPEPAESPEQVASCRE